MPRASREGANSFLPYPTPLTSRPSVITGRVLHLLPVFNPQETLRSAVMNHDLLRKTADAASRYLAGLDARPVAPKPEDVARVAELGGPLPDAPTDPADVIDLLDRYGSPATVASAGPRYFGFVIGGSLPAALAANWLAGTWDQNAGLAATSPFGSFIEDVCSRWLAEILPVDKNSTAGFVTGVTTANFSAITAARHSILIKHRWDAEANGLFNAPEIKVVVGEEVHGSLLKALSL